MKILCYRQMVKFHVQREVLVIQVYGTCHLAHILAYHGMCGDPRIPDGSTETGELIGNTPPMAYVLLIAYALERKARQMENQNQWHPIPKTKTKSKTRVMVHLMSSWMKKLAWAEKRTKPKY